MLGMLTHVHNNTISGQPSKDDNESQAGVLLSLIVKNREVLRFQLWQKYVVGPVEVCFLSCTLKLQEHPSTVCQSFKLIVLPLRSFYPTCWVCVLLLHIVICVTGIGDL